VKQNFGLKKECQYEVKRNFGTVQAAKIQVFPDEGERHAIGFQHDIIFAIFHSARL